MKKHLILLCSLLLLAACGENTPQNRVETDISGTWTGTMTVEGEAQTIRFTLSQQGGAVTGEMSAYLNPDEQTFETFGEVSGSTAGDSATLKVENTTPELVGFPAMTFTGSVAQNSYSGTVTFKDEGGISGTFELTK